MLSALKNEGLYDRTLIVLTADHGEYLGFHHLLLKGNRMYDPLAKVPLIIHSPGRQPVPGVSDALVSNTDLAPTILRAAGLNPPAAMPGQDLLAPPAVSRSLVFCAAGGGYVIARTRTNTLLWLPQP